MQNTLRYLAKNAVIVSALIAAPRVKAVRGFTDFGISYVYVIFQDNTDIYWARSRVVEYLQGIRGQLPEGVNPTIGPDATGVGWVFEYALVDETGQHSLADLRSLQDVGTLVDDLQKKPGVASAETTAKGVRVFAAGTDGLLSEVVQAANPYGLRDLTITETSLETVFIRLTGRDLRE